MGCPLSVVAYTQVSKSAKVYVISGALGCVFGEDACVGVSRIRTKDRGLLNYFTAGAGSTFRCVVFFHGFNLINRFGNVEGFIGQCVIVLFNGVFVRRDHEVCWRDESEDGCFARRVSSQDKRATRDRYLLNQVSLERGLSRGRRRRDRSGDRCRGLYGEQVGSGSVRRRRIARRSGNGVRGIIYSGGNYRRAFKIYRRVTSFPVEEVVTFFCVVRVKEQG